jgi:hypothetical protein
MEWVGVFYGSFVFGRWGRAEFSADFPYFEWGGEGGTRLEKLPKGDILKKKKTED